ncbi:hypothetical protein BD408DRAFT_422697 [Parasitella parasitica]|nr:hypothetical protein BD408DRAFT_422697 [Parasitella parasitica]
MQRDMSGAIEWLIFIPQRSRFCLSVIVDTDSALASKDTNDLMTSGNSSDMAAIHQR